MAPSSGEPRYLQKDHESVSFHFPFTFMPRLCQSIIYECDYCTDPCSVQGPGTLTRVCRGGGQVVSGMPEIYRDDPEWDVC